jgi:hypothetical protein
MRVPEGIEAPGKVCRLLKGLYGLKQAGRNWHKKIHEYLVRLGFVATSADPSMSYNKQHSLTIGLYVLIAGPCLSSILWLKAELAKLNQVKDLGEASICLGIQIRHDRNTRTLSIDQSTYVRTMLSRFGLENSRNAKTPAESNDALVKGTADKVRTDAHEYQRVVSSLMWAMLGTQPDIALVVGKLSRHSSSPTERHCTAAQRVLRYLGATDNFAISYSRQCIIAPVGYGDADYASDTDNHKFTGAYVFMIASGPVAWASKLQGCVATSTTEAE